MTMEGMDDRRIYILYLLLILSLGTILLFLGPLAYEQIRPKYYGFTVISVDRSQAAAGDVVHLTSGELDMSPLLAQALVQGEYFYLEYIRDSRRFL
jgi:hypothetical protein